MGDKLLNGNLENTLAGLADKIGTSVPHLYEVLTQQAYAESIVWTAIFGLAITTAILWYRYFKFAIKANEEGHSVLCFVIGIAGILSLLIGAIGFFSSISYLFNPEYFAIQEIGKFFK